jgi:hypothetical protein
MDAELDAKIRALKKRQETEANEPGFYSRLKSGITEKVGGVADYAAAQGYPNVSAGINTAGSMVSDMLPNDYKLGDVMAGQVELPGLNKVSPETLDKLQKLFPNNPEKVDLAIRKMSTPEFIESKRLLDAQRVKPVVAGTTSDATVRASKAADQMSAFGTQRKVDPTVRSVSSYTDATDVLKGQRDLQRDILRKKARE